LRIWSTQVFGYVDTRKQDIVSKISELFEKCNDSTVNENNQTDCLEDSNSRYFHSLLNWWRLRMR